MRELEKLYKSFQNMIELSSKSRETIEEAILKLIEETGELSSCYLKENNPDHMVEEAIDIVQASFKLAYLIQKKYPNINIFDKLLEKNEKWRSNQNVNQKSI